MHDKNQFFSQPIQLPMGDIVLNSLGENKFAEYIAENKIWWFKADRNTSEFKTTKWYLKFRELDEPYTVLNTHLPASDMKSRKFYNRHTQEDVKVVPAPFLIIPKQMEGILVTVRPATDKKVRVLLVLRQIMRTQVLLFVIV